jgi:hypothetical protein
MKIALLPDPDFLDLPAWEVRLSELRAMPAEVAGRDVSIDHAKAMIEVLGGDPKNAPVQAA